MEQKNGFSLAWILSCVFKSPFCVNVLSHLEQENGYSLMWILSCDFKLPICVNVLSHLQQTNASLLCGSFHVSSNHFLCKWLVTFGAGKRHLSCVDPSMSPQIIFLCKCLVTFGVGQKAPLLCGSFHVLSNHLYVNVLPQLEQANGFTPL